MFGNHFKIAWRSLLKNRIYSGINVLGLAVGIAAALLIYKILAFELSFNKNFIDYERIARVVRVNQLAGGAEEYSVCVPGPAWEEMKSSIPHFAAATKVEEIWTNVIVPDPKGGAPLKKLAMQDGETAFFAMPGFTDVFSFNWLRGNAQIALSNPGSIALTDDFALKCFASLDAAVGQTLIIDNSLPVKVTGIIENPPANCDFNFPFLISFETLKSNEDRFFYSESWGSCSSNSQVYVKINDLDNWNATNNLLAKVGRKEYEDNDPNHIRRHTLQPLSDLHYSRDYYNSGTHRTSRSRLGILAAVGILILLMACFNFINLTTAQSTLRSKEVGVRKTLGSTRLQVTVQFLLETAIVVVLYIFIGVLIAQICLPLLEKISDLPAQASILTGGNPILFLIALTIIVTLLSGLYPALTLGRWKPIDVLGKGHSSNRGDSGLLRKVLVITQFVIAQGLIIAALINILQLDFVRKSDLGFSEDLVYTFGFGNDSVSQSRHELLKQKLLQIPSVQQVSFSSDQPMSGNTWASNVRYGNRAEDESWHITMKFADQDYLGTYGLRLLAGKWYPASDTTRDCVINETTLHKLGFRDPTEVIGQHLGMGRRKIEITGVLEDFHTHNLRQEHSPLMISSRKEFYWQAGVKIKPENLDVAVSQIKRAFDEVLPEQVFDGTFLDESIAQFYEADRRLSSMTKGFGILAIFISCLGLFGLATHAATQRLKEFGIRKILGASVSQILGLLARDFVLMILAALLIATPISAYLMNNWLDNYVFRIDLPWMVFFITGFVAILVAVLTVSIQGFRVASTNPIQSLRDE